MRELVLWITRATGLIEQGKFCYARYEPPL
jgi:hypothetical protein